MSGRKEESAMDQAKHDNMDQNNFHEDSDHNNNFTIEADYFSIKNTKAASPSLFVRRKSPDGFKEMECQTDLDMGAFGLSTLNKSKNLQPINELQRKTAQPSVRNKTQEKIIRAREHVRQSSNQLRMSRNSNGFATQDYDYNFDL